MKPITNISIRSPFQFEDGDIKNSQGGQSTFLTNLMDSCGGSWICASDPNPDVEKYETDNYPIRIVPISDGLYDSPYDDFYNNQIHVATHNLYDSSSLPAEESGWNGYTSLNLKLAESAVEESDTNRYFVNGVQLAMVPSYIRNMDSNAKIVLYYHKTVPTPRQFKAIENYDKIVESLSKCDCIMVHTNRFKKNMIEIFQNLSYDRDNIDVTVNPGPVSVDEAHTDLSKDDEIDTTTVLSVDRMDIHKGIPVKLRGFDLFLRNNPRVHGDIRMKQKLAVGRAETLHQQKQDYETVREIASRINSRYGRQNWTPVEMPTEYLSFDELLGEYAKSDCFLATSLADGLNLTVFEYLISSKIANTNSHAIVSTEAGCTDIIDCIETAEPNATAIAESLLNFTDTNDQHIISEDNIPRINTFKRTLESEFGGYN